MLYKRPMLNLNTTLYMKQRTLLREVSRSGVALHTGHEVTLTFKPAPENHGIVFRRVDLYGKPEIKPVVDMVSEVIRNTTLTSGHTQIHTVEHVLSALNGMRIDNCIVEMNASEPPILDGSAKPFTEALMEAEPLEQEADKQLFKLEEPISVTNGNRSIIALPYDGFRITCTSTDDRATHTQHFSLDLNAENYVSQIAPARTFTIYEDIEELLNMGKIQGGSLDSAIVIKGDKILSKEPLRFNDEFVRHKILDIIGDISLLGMPIHAHIVAVRPGHALNAEFTRALHKRMTGADKPRPPRPAERQVLQPDACELDIRRILNTLPQRYPFVMVDRVLRVDEASLEAIKNVTINEPYFVGHFPGHPVMPGVMQIEAMAQAAGILLLQKVELGKKVTYFMSADKVKFRHAVVPGDQIHIHVKLIKVRGNRIGVAAGECRVDDRLVSSAELMFTFAEPDNQ